MYFGSQRKKNLYLVEMQITCGGDGGAKNMGGDKTVQEEDRERRG